MPYFFFNLIPKVSDSLAEWIKKKTLFFNVLRFWSYSDSRVQVLTRFWNRKSRLGVIHAGQRLCVTFDAITNLLTNLNVLRVSIFVGTVQPSRLYSPTHPNDTDNSCLHTSYQVYSVVIPTALVYTPRTRYSLVIPTALVYTHRTRYSVHVYFTKHAVTPRGAIIGKPDTQRSVCSFCRK